MDTRWHNFANRVVIIVALAWIVRDVQAASPAKAAHAPNGSIYALLRSPDAVDMMSMQCLPSDSSSKDLAEVNCEFKQLLVTKKPPLSTADVQAYAKELRERLADPANLKKLIASCPESSKYLTETRALQSQPHKIALIDRERTEVETLCACKTVDCAVAALVEIKSAKTRNACDVTHTHFERTFKQKSPTQWVSVSGPAGLCDIVLTLVIEYNAAEDSWSFTQKRVVTSSEPQCQGFESTTKSYSNPRYLSSALMNCEMIDTLLP